MPHVDLTPKQIEVIPKSERIQIIEPEFQFGTQPGDLVMGGVSEMDEYLAFTFYENSVAAATGKGIPATIAVDRECTILEVFIHVETAPGAGKTITVDVNKNGTTIFATQGNRPSITETSTTDKSGTPDTTLLEKNDLLTMDIDTHDGAAAKLSVYVRCKKAL